MRFFVGVPVPSADAFARATSDLQAAAPGARPVPDGTWHVTLRFLGDLDAPGPVVAALGVALRDAIAVHADVAGVGAFQSPQRARVAWASVEAPGLEAVEARVREATTHMGRPPPRRDFVPHVTLARLRHPTDLSSWVRHHAATRFFEGTLDTVVLYRSTLTRHGAVYTREAVFRLRDAAEA